MSDKEINNEEGGAKDRVCGEDNDDDDEKEKEALDVVAERPRREIWENAVGGVDDDDADTVTCCEGEEDEDEGEKGSSQKELIIAETDSEQLALLAEQQQSSVFSPSGSSTSKQDYRLDFTEVEGTLEAVPEEGTANAAAATANMSSAPAAVSAAPIQDDNPIQDSASTSYYVPATVPESNASDFGGAFSEYSFAANGFGNGGGGGGNGDQSSTASGIGPWYIRSSEPLTARQQVALWLTRTSISDMSSMPSLRSLVFPKSAPKGQSANSGRSHHHHHASHHKSRRSKSEIKRNFSTKSLMVSKRGRNDDDDDAESGLSSASPPMRKCSTMMSLPGDRVSMQGSASSKPIPVPGSSNGSHGRNKPSSFSLFRRLANPRRGDREGDPSSSANKRVPGIAFSFTSAGSGCESPLRMYGQGIRPTNRLRSTAGSSSMVMCSRCASVVSFSNSRLTSRAASQISISIGPGRKASFAEPEAPCKICLMDTPLREMARLQECACSFCKDCMQQYVTMEVSEGAYDISCPDPECERKGVLAAQEIENIAGREVADRHRVIRLNTEVALDRNRTWCPAPDCGTICHICSPPHLSAGAIDTTGVSVSCPSCQKEFCSRCQANAHPGKTCAQNGEELVRGINSGGDQVSVAPAAEFYFGGGGGIFSSGDIKPCPMCRVPIERDAGCAQMMCKRCKHVFCWFCLTSLDDDFLLRHYDSGRCKGKLGHSRASILFHRAQVVAIFAGFGFLLLLASPLLLLAAPCILCCRCKLLDKLDNLDNLGSSRSNKGRDDSAAAEDGEVNIEDDDDDEVVEAAETAPLSKQSSFEIRPAAS